VAIHPYCYNICLMHIHPNAMPDYVAIKAIAIISVVASIINHNVSLRGNNHDYCNNIKDHCRVLLQRYYLLPLLNKVTLLLLKDIATNMTLLQSYFTVATDRFLVVQIPSRNEPTMSPHLLRLWVTDKGP
jgi:hypothetical protein